MIFRPPLILAEAEIAGLMSRNNLALDDWLVWPEDGALSRWATSDFRRRAAAIEGLAMKICVIGAGSIGGLLAARLARAGEEVSVIARGAHLEAIKRDGLRLVEAEGGEFAAKVAATDKIRDLGAQDCVILGMKAHQVAAVAAEVPALLDRDATVLTAQNGVPWWYFFKHGGEHEGRRLEAVDPGGVIADHLPIDRIIGSVVYAAAEIVAPGVVNMGFPKGICQFHLRRPRPDVLLSDRAAKPFHNMAGERTASRGRSRPNRRSGRPPDFAAKSTR